MFHFKKRRYIMDNVNQRLDQLFSHAKEQEPKASFQETKKAFVTATAIGGGLYALTWIIKYLTTKTIVMTSLIATVVVSTVIVITPTGEPKSDGNFKNIVPIIEEYKKAQSVTESTIVAAPEGVVREMTNEEIGQKKEVTIIIDENASKHSPEFNSDSYSEFVVDSSLYNNTDTVYATNVSRVFQSDVLYLKFDRVYNGENIYIQNPFSSTGRGFCVKEIIINKKSIKTEVKVSAFEIDLAKMGFKKGDKVHLEIGHEPNCLPKLLN
jgi:hypothetical protein